MSAEREAEQKARDALVRRIDNVGIVRLQGAATRLGVKVEAYRSIDAYRAAIETRVRAEVDAEWRARVEGDAVDANAEQFRDQWTDKSESYWLARLMQEVGELASALVGDHADSPEHELAQIGGIAKNWLRHRALLTAVARDREGKHG